MYIFVIMLFVICYICYGIFLMECNLRIHWRYSTILKTSNDSEVTFFDRPKYVYSESAFNALYIEIKQIFKKFPSDKMNGIKNALFSRAPTHHSFTFNLRFLYELKHKVRVLKLCVGFFIFDSVSVFLKLQIVNWSCKFPTFPSFRFCSLHWNQKLGKLGKFFRAYNCFVGGSCKFLRFLSFQFWYLYWNRKLGELGNFFNVCNCLVGGSFKFPRLPSFRFCSLHWNQKLGKLGHFFKACNCLVGGSCKFPRFPSFRFCPLYCTGKLEHFFKTSNCFVGGSWKFQTENSKIFPRHVK